MKSIKKLLDPAKLIIWILCELPLLALLLYSAFADPAEGFEPGTRSFGMYIPAVLFTVFFSMLLNWFKGFLVLYFGKVNCGFVESGVLLGRIHSFMALLEALATALLFLIRNSGVYGVLSQIQLFGHELLYAALFWLYLREKSEVSYRKCAVIALACFLASSAWLLLSVIASI